MEVMNPSHTRGLLRWGNRNTTQRLRIKLPPPSMQGGRPTGCRGVGDIPSQLKLKWEAAPQLPTLSTLNVSRWGKSERNLIPPVLEGRSLRRTRAIGSFCFVLNSILKSFSLDLPHKDKLDFHFLCRENNAIYLIFAPQPLIGV